MSLRLIPCGECSFTSNQIRFCKRNTYLDYRTFEDVIGTYVCLVTILDNFLAVIVKNQFD